jgi:soluble P-type ATPase
MRNFNEKSLILLVSNFISYPMITIEITGMKTVEIQHLVLDFNGTLAFDGHLIQGVQSLLETLAKSVSVHVITADTFGSVKNELSEIPCNIVITGDKNQQLEKMNFVKTLGCTHVAAFGNGANDALMLKTARIGIALLQKEGTTAETLVSSHIVCHSITDALELFIHTDRLRATLRK